MGVPFNSKLDQKVLDMIETGFESAARPTVEGDKEENGSSMPARELRVVIRELLIGETLLCESALRLAHIDRNNTFAGSNSENVATDFRPEVRILLPEETTRLLVNYATGCAFHYGYFERAFDAKGDHGVSPLLPSLTFLCGPM
jgi:hypothetical protein